MTDSPFLKIVGETQLFAQVFPTFEESLFYQAKLLGYWEQQQRVLGYTEASIALSSSKLNEFLRVAGKFIWEVTAHDVDRFHEQLVGRGLAYSTRRKYQSHITTFLDYLRARHAHDIWQRYRVAIPTVLDKFNRHTHRLDDREGAVAPPQPEILERFWEGLKAEMPTARKFAPLARDYALFRVLALAGLRITEALMLEVKDCRFDLGEHGKLHVRFGKGSRGSGPKARWVPLLDGLDQILRWYLEQIRPLFTQKKEGIVFLSEEGERIASATVRNNLIRRQKHLGFTDEEIFSPHQLRHAFASGLTERGVDLLTMKELLGHVEVGTTFNYITPSSEYLETRVRLSQEKWRQQLLSEKE